MTLSTTRAFWQLSSINSVPFSDLGVLPLFLLVIKEALFSLDQIRSIG